MSQFIYIIFSAYIYSCSISRTGHLLVLQLLSIHLPLTPTLSQNAPDEIGVILNYFEDIYLLQHQIILHLPTCHLPPITKTIQARRTRHAGHCWRSKDEIVSDVLLWTPAYGQSKAGRSARTFIQQLCDDKGCSPEDLPKAMNDRETWRERVRDIRASRPSWWWWWPTCENDYINDVIITEEAATSFFMLI